MFTRRTRYLFLVVALNVAAVLAGVAAADTLASRGVPAASASNTCTHYTPTYFTGDPNTQPQNCYGYGTCCYSYNFGTTGIAIRDSNAFSYLNFAHPASLWYQNTLETRLGPYWTGTARYQAIGSSGTSLQAWCHVESGLDQFYCTTLYTT